MSENLRISVLTVNQWLDYWDNVPFSNSAEKYRRKPEPRFYLFSIKAVYLKRLSKIYRRTDEKRRAIQQNIQRQHDPKRSDEIARFLKDGFPLSEIKSYQISNDREKYRMPGWLPTSIVANILLPGTFRNGQNLKEEDSIKVDKVNNTHYLYLPDKVEDEFWDPQVAPIEIIDGQHRLLSFDESDPSLENYELPVVAFLNLDITWQAYLFYTINIKPKRINKSLAYDLYPLLRTADWLEGSMNEKSVYKEIRAQEIVEVLWAYEKGSWYNRINMLGETGKDYNITQGSFVRNITNTFFKSTGLFLGRMNDDGTPLGWSRVQQAAFIVFIWEKLFAEIKREKPYWYHQIVTKLAPLFSTTDILDDTDLFKDVIFSKYSLLTTDQGIRGYMSIIHDLLYHGFDHTRIRELYVENSEDKMDDILDLDDIQQSMEILEMNEDFSSFISQICSILRSFEWRTSSFPDLPDDIAKNQKLFKGSGGYKEIREQLLKKIVTEGNEKLKVLASKLLKG